MTDVTTSTREAAGWLDANWQSWVDGILRIVVVVLLALVLRAVVRKLIDQLIHRMAREAEHSDSETSSRLGGLLVNTERRMQRSAAIGSVLRSVASFSIMGTASLMVLSQIGVDLAPLLASAGVAGVALGFGARNLVTDFLSGVFMIMEDQYGVGDEIDMGVATGTVLEVGLRVTKLRGADGEIWYIRNGEVKRIANMSQGWSTATVDVQVGYREDLDRVEELILATAEAFAKEAPWDELLWEPVSVLGVESVTADTVVVRVQAKTMPSKAQLVARALRGRLKAAFDGAGIKLKEEAGVVAAAKAAAAVADAQAPSSLADPSSARSLASRPIPPPSPEEQQAFSKLP
ncbi:mechanosensitive ion channel family protein [Kitasatospora viridis]|uniref:Small conductance mechanosensitive channel n=1 Tax=Kitasatospora viridis TaxID=281105 RepID=A0A561UDN0_9ACTN|nr:mechanosensitive ion channel family protein [Kitasatospora viridis]TWF97479.1 small conductance mechanosensitive channel [Kitasatospora viridis]